MPNTLPRSNSGPATDASKTYGDPKTTKLSTQEDLKGPLPPVTEVLTKILNGDNRPVTEDDAEALLAKLRDFKEKKVGTRVSMWDVILPFGISLKTSVTLVSSCLFCFILGRFHFSVVWIVVLLTLVAHAWERVLARHYLHIREQVVRELVQLHDDKVTESVEFLNEFVQKYWVLVEPKISSDLCAQIQSALDKNKPSALNDLKISTFTLGSNAPRIQFVRTFTRLGQDVVRLFTHISWTPLHRLDAETSQARKEEEKRQVNVNQEEFVDHDYKNAKIRVDARFGVGPAAVSVPIEVTNLAVEINLILRIKMSPDYPHVQSIRMYSPIELMPPQVDFSLKPLGMIDVTALPVISPLLKSQTEGVLQRLLHEPGYLVEFDRKTPTFSSDWTAFVVRARVIDGWGLKNKGTALFGSVSDPYCRVTLNNREVGRTSVRPNTLQPTWDQAVYILVPAHALSAPGRTDMLRFSVYDKNEIEKDQHMGSTTYLPLSDWLHFGLPDWTMSPTHLRLANEFGYPHMVENPTTATLLSTNGMEHRGTIRLELSAASVSRVAYDPTVVGPPSGGGVVRVSCLQATGLGGGAMAKPVDSYLCGYLDQNHVWRSNVRPGTNHPFYSTFFDVFVPNVDVSVISLEVRDKSIGKDPLLGRADIRLRSVLARKSADDWYRLSGGSAEARIRLRFELYQVRFGANWARMDWDQPEGLPVEPEGSVPWPEDLPSNVISTGLSRSDTLVRSNTTISRTDTALPTTLASPDSNSPGSNVSSPNITSISPMSPISPVPVETFNTPTTLNRRVVVARPVQKPSS